MFSKKYTYVYLGLAVLGGLAGWFYWFNWGCTDACPINSSWKLMSLKGGIIGICLAAIFHPSIARQNEK